MARTTQIKGDLAKVKSILYFTQAGYNVSLPISESLPYDILVERDGIINKVQV